ncbi:MAG: D-inositol-3-phosphate glycosyltransferase [Actinomycetota bacterium]|nr:MAG: D-inositol-3-phosphate glycosyltransferase [Actinomycetota bacterium]
MTGPRPLRVALISVHTSPNDQPGIGDSGGMNVAIHEVAERLAADGARVDVFTRCRGGADHEPPPIARDARVVSIKAGPCAPVPKEELPRYLPTFLGGVLRHVREAGVGYDLVHSHYWLSGWVGRAVRELWGTPLVSSFHTLGKVKNYALALGESPEPPARLAAEERAIAASDRIVAPTSTEAGQLVGLYRADPARIRVVPLGVDPAIFRPLDRDAARRRLHLSGLRLALVVGRVQAHKGPDVAVRALAEAVASDPVVARDLVLAFVGGPSGHDGGSDIAGLMHLAGALGVADRVIFFPPQPQRRLADFYAAADVVLVPSRSESFGLVALEAQACGTPVVAAAVGGLRIVVEHGRTGLLVEGHDPGDHAAALLEVLRDPGRQAALGAAGARLARRWTWEASAARMRAVYEELAAAR